MAALTQRIESKFTPEPNTGCWLWHAAINDAGYGIAAVGTSRADTRTRVAHRVIYELMVGPIPTGMDLDHLCRVRCCVNPDHLEPVTRRENLRRGIGAEITRARHAAVTHCPSGHEYSEDNTRIGKRGERYCLTCKREKCRAWRARHGH